DILYFHSFPTRRSSDLNTIVAVRSAMTATLTKATRGGPMFVHAFILGFNIAVAEAQATAGPDARQVVLLALTNARNDAKSLQLEIGRAPSELQSRFDLV